GEVPSPDPMLAHVLARALDQDSRPIQGATLECLDGRRARAESGADGRIELSLAAFPTAFELSFSLRAPGFATREASAAVAQGARGPCGDLVLAPGGTIGGKVQDGGGQPVEGALLQVVELDRPHEEYESLRRQPFGERSVVHALSSADGSFVLEGAPVG